MAAVTICSDLGAQESKICHCFHSSPSICHEVVRPDAMILAFWILNFQPSFSLFISTLIKRLFIAEMAPILCPSLYLHSLLYNFVQFSSLQLLSHVQLFVTPWIAAHQASLFITNSQSLLKLTSIKSVMPSSHLILCHRLLLLPPIPPSIRVFYNEATLWMRWPKDLSFN